MKINQIIINYNYCNSLYLSLTHSLSVCDKFTNKRTNDALKQIKYDP